MAFVTRLDERERLIAAFIAMCLLAGVIALGLHPESRFGSAALEDGSLAAPPGEELLHETAGAGDVPPDVALATGGAGGSGGDTPEPSPNAPNSPAPPDDPPDEPPPDPDLISRLLSELPKLPPPPLNLNDLAGGGRR